jgi:hypothetical protein
MEFFESHDGSIPNAGHHSAAFGSEIDADVNLRFQREQKLARRSLHGKAGGVGDADVKDGWMRGKGIFGKF